MFPPKGVWGFTPKTCASASGGLGVYPQNVRKHVPGVLRGQAPLRRSQGGASSQSPFMFGAVGRLPPLTSLPCSSFSAKRHAKVACSVVNALTTALFCYHLFAVLRAVARYFCGASPHTLLRGQAPLKPPLCSYCGCNPLFLPYNKKGCKTL